MKALDPYRHDPRVSEWVDRLERQRGGVEDSAPAVSIERWASCWMGPSDLEAVDRALLPQVLQDTAWQIAFRQGSPQDAERMQTLFAKAWVKDESWSSDGRTMTRRVERWRVQVDWSG